MGEGVSADGTTSVDEGAAADLGADGTGARDAYATLAEEKLCVLFELLPFPAALSRLPEGTLLEINAAFERTFGRSRQEAVGRTSIELGLFDDPQVRAVLRAEAEQKGSIRGAEITLRTVDGPRLFSLDLSTTTIGDQRYVLQVVQDITERKRLEQAEQERAKLSDQLVQARKMDAIGNLAGGVAHDFNNMLSVILSYTGMALDSLRDGDPLREDLSEVRKAAEHATSLTRQLLAFGRRQVLKPVSLDLNEVVGNLEKMLRRILGEDLDLKFELSSGLARTLADPGQIEQVIMNLVVNARDAMPAGGVLTVGTSNVELDAAHAATRGATPGSYVRVAVTDTGAGMAPDTRERCFEPFFTTKEKGKGTGLGLSTAYGIVKQSGGHISVDSERGRGTTFEVFLPRAASPCSGEATIGASGAPSESMRGTETILVVEDETALRNLARRILQKAGYCVLTAASGGEALLVCEQHAGEIHLLLTDVIMPQMSGKTLVERLARIRPATKALYMSGYPGDALVPHGEFGEHFIGKPFTASDLTKKVREVLDA